MTETGKPRLLVLTSTYPRWPGDPEPGFVHELAKRLVVQFEVTVVAPHARGALSREVLDGVSVIRYRYAPDALETLVNDGGILANLRRQAWKWLLVPGFLVSMLWVTWRTVCQARTDVVHAHWLIPQGIVVALLGLLDWRMPPFVLTSHGADLYALRARPLQAMKRFVVRRAAEVTVVSHAMRTELLRLGAQAQHVSVEPMGVDLSSRFTPDASALRSRDEILFVGRLVEKKGLRYLIDAMPIILAERPSAFLTIAGFGPEEEGLQMQTGMLGLAAKVRFMGPVPQEDLATLYRRAAVFVAPFIEAESGDQEGLGLVLVEAAGCDCPVVTCAVAAVREVIGDHALGTIVQQRDPQALAQAILAVLEGRSQSETIYARQAMRDRFDWMARARAYALLLTRALVQS
jgi:glycosyltransferase involved in cell wall biosynthesis